MTSEDRRQRIKHLIWILVVCVALDQSTKVYAIHSLQAAGRMSYLGDTIRIEYAENSGAFLSMGGALSKGVRFAVFTVLNAVFLGGVAWYLLRKSSSGRIEFWALALLLGGGIGNLIDRVIHDGHVIDFLNLGVGGLRTGIFNVADVAITAAAIGLIVVGFRRPEQDEDHATKAC